MTAQASFNPRNGLVVPAPAPGTPEAVDAVMAAAGVTTGPFGIVHPWLVPRRVDGVAA